MRLYSWGRLAVLSGALAGSLRADDAWPGWGGPTRDFRPAGGAKLADAWGADGPHLLWSASVGGGHSAVVVAGGRVYVHHRHAERAADTLTALDATSGEKIWEQSYDAPMQDGMMLDFGPGPHATPAVVDGRIFTLSAVAQLSAFDAQDGRPLWSHDLVAEHGARVPPRGYGLSPVAIGGRVIANAGSPEVGLVAFDQATGELAWKSEPLGGGYPTPLPCTIGERAQLVVALGPMRAGVDPADGAVLWQHPVDRQSAGVMATPLHLGDGRVLCSAAYGGGTRLLEVKPAGDAWEVTEAWHTRAMKVQHGNLVRIDERHVVGSSGDFGPAFLMCIDVADGSIAWRERGFEKATLLGADDKLLVLDQTGRLALARATRERFEILSEAKVLEERAWTAPTLVGDRLYVRDYHSLKAFDLSPQANR